MEDNKAMLVSSMSMSRVFHIYPTDLPTTITYIFFYLPSPLITHSAISV